jgi:large subunit ribosomal protein L3
MSLGLIGKKVGMTQIYNKDGSALAVTVISVASNQVLQVKKSTGKDGYSGIQLGFDPQKDHRINKPETGHFKRWGGASKKQIVEFRMESDDNLPEPGTELNAELFAAGAWVDVIGTTKGKGFQGVVKRHGFAGQPMSHGHMMHRRPGSIGCRLTPGLVWKNQKMPGHDGQVRRTVQNLKIVQSRPEDGVLLVSGAVPGSNGSYVIVRPAKKKPVTKSAE